MLRALARTLVGSHSGATLWTGQRLGSIASQAACHYGDSTSSGFRKKHLQQNHIVGPAAATGAPLARFASMIGSTRASAARRCNVRASWWGHRQPAAAVSADLELDAGGLGEVIDVHAVARSHAPEPTAEGLIDERPGTDRPRSFKRGHGRHAPGGAA